MSTRTVRLDEDAEATLKILQKQTGMSITTKPYDIYRKLDLGPGDESVSAALMELISKTAPSRTTSGSYPFDAICGHRPL